MTIARLKRAALMAAIGLAVIAIVGAILLHAYGLPDVDFMAAQSPFSYVRGLDVERTAPDGTRFTVNSSTASFELDIATPDAHCDRLFADHASALAYCASNDLPVVPSVQLVQAACKQFDDAFCAALELAMQRGAVLPAGKGKQACLRRLAARLEEASANAAEETRNAAEAALAHVVAALRLGGIEIPAAEAVLARAAALEGQFLADPMHARPIGFWDSSEEHRALFMQDRFLMEGLKLPDEASAAFVLAATVARDRELAADLESFASFDAALCAPPESRTALVTTLSALLPDGIAVDAAVMPAEFARAAGSATRVALVSYAACKEIRLLAELACEGPFPGSEAAMDLVIDAIKSGRLSLTPGEHAGWYDYQLHAIETLVLPERASEAGKLSLSAAYKDRLAEAFAAAFTRYRDQHIKHLPVLTLCQSLDHEGPITVEVAPEFSVEPVATVYLRIARGYRFLRTALAAILPEGALAGISRHGSNGKTRALQEELSGMMLRMYGLCELLAADIGLEPSYLRDEIEAEERQEARSTALAWLAALAGDRDLHADTRVAVPVFRHDPGGPTRYWATAGVRLQKAVYAYGEKPEVSGNVEPVFVRTRCYLPTDMFIEFEGAGATPPTRDEFRALCDRAGSVGELRALFGLPPLGGNPWRRMAPWALAAILCVAALAMHRTLRAAPRYRRVVRWTFRTAVAVAAGTATIWVFLMAFSPAYRLAWLVKHIAPINNITGACFEIRMANIALDEPVDEPAIEALVGLMGDSDAQVRYLAARYLAQRVDLESRRDGDLLAEPRIDASLRRAAEDPMNEVAGVAIDALGRRGDTRTLGFLRTKLGAWKDDEARCACALSSLGRIGDASTVDLAVGFTADRRGLVRSAAVRSLAEYDDSRALARLADLAASVAPADRHVVHGIRRALNANMRYEGIDEATPECSEWRRRFVPIFAAAIGNRSFSFRDRADWACVLTPVELRANAYAALGQEPVDADSTEERQEVIRKLGELAEVSNAAFPVLLRLFVEDPDEEIREAAGSAVRVVLERLTAFPVPPGEDAISVPEARKSPRKTRRARARAARRSSTRPPPA